MYIIIFIIVIFIDSGQWPTKQLRSEIIRVPFGLSAFGLVGRGDTGSGLHLQASGLQAKL